VNVLVRGTKVKWKWPRCQASFDYTFECALRYCGQEGRRNKVRHCQDWPGAGQGGRHGKKGTASCIGSIPIKGAEDNPKRVHAMAEVLARTWYEGRQPVELKAVEKIRTGRKKDNVTLVCFRKKLICFIKR